MYSMCIYIYMTQSVHHIICMYVCMYIYIYIIYIVYVDDFANITIKKHAISRLRQRESRRTRIDSHSNPWNMGPWAHDEPLVITSFHGNMML